MGVITGEGREVLGDVNVGAGCAGIVGDKTVVGENGVTGGDVGVILGDVTPMSSCVKLVLDMLGESVLPDLAGAALLFRLFLRALGAFWLLALFGLLFPL